MFGKEHPNKLRIGWIIGNQLNESRLFYRLDVRTGGIGLARYYWIAAAVNANPDYRLRYEIFKPWKRYDALLFLKSMGKKSMDLIKKFHHRGQPVIFDVNVNYYHIDGTEYFSMMLPSEQQKEEAIEITKSSDGIIADSEFLRQVCVNFNPNICWIPDNIPLDRVPHYKPWRLNGGRLPLLWSGEAVKLFELLLIEEILKSHSSKIELVLVTNNLTALDRWHPGYKDRFLSLLDQVPHRIIPYQSIEHLFEIYSKGGVVISPRFLDNSYNFGHTEWKITLGMACGRMVLCSPVPSYIKVAQRADGKGIRICRSLDDWKDALEAIFSKCIDWEKEELGSKAVVEKYYSTIVVAKTHADFVHKVVDRDL